MAEREIPTGSERKTRISAKVREAIRLMVEEGRSRSDAATACEITDDWLYRSLQKPECRALRASLLGSLRESEASRVIKRVADLADSSKSDAVKLDANQWLADVAGEGPVKRDEITHFHRGLVPGLTVNFVSYPEDAQPALIDQAAPRALPLMSNGAPLPPRVPHPTELRERDKR